MNIYDNPRRIAEPVACGQTPKCEREAPIKSLLEELASAVNLLSENLGVLHERLSPVSNRACTPIGEPPGQCKELPPGSPILHHLDEQRSKIRSLAQSVAQMTSDLEI